jgi:hypothetical protein
MSFPRRQFLKYGCSCAIGLVFSKSLQAQVPLKNSVYDFRGTLFINKSPGIVGQEIKSGDTITTGISSKATILFGGDVYHLKESTTFVLPSDSNAKSSVISGAILGAFTPGKPKKIQVGDKVVLSIRGTGIYIEVGAESSDFCLCYGQANLSSNKSDVDIITDTKFHKDYTIQSDGEIRPTYWYDRRLTHTSRQNIELEKLAGRTSPFDGGLRDWVAQFEDPEL